MGKEPKIETPTNTSIEPSTEQKAASAPEPELFYSTGYRRPPAETRWKPGQSGNPSGRPKGPARQKKLVALGTLERKVKVAKSGTTRNASVRQVAFERIGDKAVAGDIRSIDFLLRRESQESPLASEQVPVNPEKALEILRAYFARELANKKECP